MKSVYENFETGEVIQFHQPRDLADLQAIVDRFLARHPIPEDVEKTRRIDAILERRRRAARAAKGLT